MTRTIGEAELRRWSHLDHLAAVPVAAAVTPIDGRGVAQGPSRDKSLALRIAPDFKRADGSRVRAVEVLDGDIRIAAISLDGPLRGRLASDPDAGVVIGSPSADGERVTIQAGQMAQAIRAAEERLAERAQRGREVGGRLRTPDGRDAGPVAFQASLVEGDRVGHRVIAFTGAGAPAPIVLDPATLDDLRSAAMAGSGYRVSSPATGTLTRHLGLECRLDAAALRDVAMGYAELQAPDRTPARVAPPRSTAPSIATRTIEKIGRASDGRGLVSIWVTAPELSDTATPVGALLANQVSAVRGTNGSTGRDAIEALSGTLGGATRVGVLHLDARQLSRTLAGADEATARLVSEGIEAGIRRGQLLSASRAETATRRMASGGRER